MNPKDIEFATKNLGIKPFLEDFKEFKNPYDGILTPSQVSKVIESILAQLPLPIIWIDFFGKDIFGNGYILSAVKDFQENNIKIKNNTGLFEIYKNHTWEQIDRSSQRRIDETYITIKMLTNVDSGIAQKVKELVWSVSVEQNYVVNI